MSGFAGDEDLDDEDRELMGLPPKGKGGRKDLASMGAGSGKLQPRESKVSANLATREMMELFSSTPPGTPQVNQGQRSQTPSLHSNEGTTSVANKRASGVGGRMRNLFGRKGSGSVSERKLSLLLLEVVVTEVRLQVSKEPQKVLDREVIQEMDMDMSLRTTFLALSQTVLLSQVKSLE